MTLFKLMKLCMLVVLCCCVVHAQPPVSTITQTGTTVTATMTGNVYNHITNQFSPTELICSFSRLDILGVRISYACQYADGFGPQAQNGMLALVDKDFIGSRVQINNNGFNVNGVFTLYGSAISYSVSVGSTIKNGVL